MTILKHSMSCRLTKPFPAPGVGPCGRQDCSDLDGTQPVPPPAYDGDFYKRLIDNLYDAVYFVDCERRITYWNRAAETLTGFSAAEVIGRHCSDDILVHTDGNGTGLCQSACPLSATLRDGRAREEDVYFRHKDGHRVSVFIRVQPIFGPEGKIVGAVEVFSDNAARRNAEQKVSQLEKMAFLDSLTRVPNRRFMEMRLRQAIEEAHRYGHRFGVMLADLDHFKEINDRHGHSVGDSALIVVARTLTRGLRAVDNVGRWGGDEFAIILREVSQDDTRRLGERCRALIEQSRVTVLKDEVRIGVSIGGTLILPADTCESAMHRADEMLYQSKKQGRGCVSIG